MKSLRVLASVVLPLFAAGACTAADDAGPADAGADGGDVDGGTVTEVPVGEDGAVLVEAAAPCGADAGAPCAVGAACATSADCEGTCTAGICAAPSVTDGKRSPSLGETDVDCGGAAAPKCADERTCASDGDCASTVCSTLSKRCVAGASCRGTASGASGIETCGIGETGSAGAAHESCCRSLPLPVRKTRRLDRYEITSGRLRAFIDQLSASMAGVPNVRAYAKSYAASHPTSQLAQIATSYPGLLDVLPDHAGTSNPLPLPVHLGAFALDPHNTLNGCFTGPGTYGHATYWQPAADIGPYGVSTNGVRKYPRTTLDEKPVNCVMPLLLAAFCAWDGGELARTEDFHEIWGRRATPVGIETVYPPWSAMLQIGQFNFRNGKGDACSVIPWPGCADPPQYFYAFPAASHDPSEDDSPAVTAPGRMALDVTGITSASGEGWRDIGGNMIETAWPATLDGGMNALVDVCDSSASPGPGDTACNRNGIPGVLRYAGALPHITLVGYSFEGHNRRGEAYLASVTGDETLFLPKDRKPITFQYGKTTGRCARAAP